MYTRDEYGYQMYPDNAFQVEGGGRGGFMNRKVRLWGGGGGKGSAPSSNAGMIASAESAREIANIQKQTADDYLNFAKSQYEELKPMLASITNSQLQTDAENRARGAEYANYERNTFRPLEQSIVADAASFNTETKQREFADRAAADVKSAFGVARDQSTRGLASFGINPNSGRFASLNNQLSTAEALGVAGAATRARSDAEQMGFARKMDAAGLGRNLASNASTAYGISLSASDAAGRSGMAGANYMGGAYGQAGNMYGGAANSYGTAGNIYGQEFNTRMQGYQADSAATGALYQGIGSMVGTAGGMGFASYMRPTGKADGGAIKKNGIHVGGGDVKGPGGPVDDKVPALLSNGEYVLPADTVRAIGVKNLDSMVSETHTPAAVQRKKQALKGKK